MNNILAESQEFNKDILDGVEPTILLDSDGVSFKELLDAISVVAECNVVAADVNELAPMLDTSGASTAVACKVVRELLLAVLSKR